MNIGLSEEQVKQIVGAVKDAGASKAAVFGSRAKGNWRENSDVDVAVFGDGINLGKLSSQLDELNMPYKFDVVEYNSISYAPLRDHIDRVGVEIYAQET